MRRRDLIVGLGSSGVLGVPQALAQTSPTFAGWKLRGGSRLHPALPVTSGFAADLDNQITSIARERFAAITRLSTTPTDRRTIPIQMTSVTLDYNFDALLSVSIASQPPIATIFDTGNTSLILPDFEAFRDAPEFKQNYRILKDKDLKEPFGCPAVLIKGPVGFAATTGSYVIPDCVFFACTGPRSSDGERTSNFGAGVVSRWPAVKDVGPVMPPFAYDQRYPYLEIDLAPAISSSSPSLFRAKIDRLSEIRLHRTPPAGFQMFSIVKDSVWMALRPYSVSVGKWRTGWPQQPSEAIAMMDTGGGPIFLSDPTGLLKSPMWRENGKQPTWSLKDSTDCRFTADPVTIEVGDETSRFTYTVDTDHLPDSVKGFTLLRCERCQYMRDQKGMNIGGLSGLFVKILVDFAGKRIGLKRKPVN